MLAQRDDEIYRLSRKKITSTVFYEKHTGKISNSLTKYNIRLKKYDEKIILGNMLFAII